jgi:hypothetical protein
MGRVKLVLGLIEDQPEQTAAIAQTLQGMAIVVE